MSEELNKHTLTTLLFVYVGMLFLIYIKNFSNSSSESVLALMSLLILTVTTYYIYDFRDRVLAIKIPLQVVHLVASLFMVVLLTSFDFKIIVYIISLFGLHIYSFFYVKIGANAKVED
jgi:hypothetical protein